MRALAVAAMALAAACESKPERTADSPFTASDTARARAAADSSEHAALPPFLPGVWSRDFIRRRGVLGENLRVRYLQALGPFGDVRIPSDRASNAKVGAFDDLTDAQLRVLARQKGFTGHTTFDGRVVTWHHEIDFQPDSSRDASNVSLVDDLHFLETGLDSSFVEQYTRLPLGDGRRFAMRVERNGRLDRVLIVVGDWFYFARNRATALPAAASFDALIAAKAPTRAQLIAWLDCELSAGRVSGGVVPWEIQTSTLPWREGRHLAFVDALSVDSAHRVVFPAASAGERWSVTQQVMTPAALSALFAHARARQ